MGSAESLGALHVEVDSPNYQSGDTVTGTVHLLAKQSISASSVLLFLKGTERTQWWERVGHGKKSRAVRRAGKSAFLRQRFSVFPFANGQIEAGQYSFPFSVALPRDLLSTFEYTVPWIPILNDGQTHGLVQYRLVAKLENAGANVEKGRTKLFVTKNAEGLAAEYSEERTVAIQNCCCSSRGAVHLRVSLDKTTYIPGETALVTMEVSNDRSQVNTEAFCVSLKQVIRLRSNSGLQHVFYSEVNSVTTEVVLIAGKSTSDNTRIMKLMIPTEETVEKVASVRSSLVECVYTIEARVRMAGWTMLCATVPTVSKNVTVCPPQMEKEQTPSVEGGWIPKVMPARQFAAGPDYAYQTNAQAINIDISD